jgi:hypothetical protein
MPDNVSETDGPQDNMFLTVKGESGAHKILYGLGFTHPRHESDGRMGHLFALIDASFAIE